MGRVHSILKFWYGMQKITILLIVCIAPLCLTAQSKKGKQESKTYKNSDYYGFKNDIGINVTNVLASVFSLNGEKDPNPFSLIYRRHYSSTSLRIGTNFTYKKTSQQEFTSGAFLSRDLDESNGSLRVGLEKHLPLSNKFMFSYGFDLLGNLTYEKSEVTENTINGVTNFFSATQNAYSTGAGPIIRFDFKLSDRMILSTESAIYATRQWMTSSVSINGVRSDDPTRAGFDLVLSLPQSLYFNVLF
jgi:hypothetical protein